MWWTRDTVILTFQANYRLFYKSLLDYYRKVGKIAFPFANDTSLECGLLLLHDCRDPHQIMKTSKIKLERKETLLYDVETISQANIIQIN